MSSQPNNNIIEFYTDTPTYSVFSNFYKGKPIFLDGKSWPTSEHYYQSMKFYNLSPEANEYVNLMNQADTVNKLYVLAQQSAPGYKSNWALIKGSPDKLGEIIKKYKALGVKPREDWDKIKDQVMYKIVKAKFEKDPFLTNILVGTDDKILVEHTSRDKYWGDGGFSGNGIPNTIEGGTMTGLNRLGEILMQVRDELRGKEVQQIKPIPTSIGKKRLIKRQVPKEIEIEKDQIIDEKQENIGKNQLVKKKLIKKIPEKTKELKDEKTIVLFRHAEPLKQKTKKFNNVNIGIKNPQDVKTTVDLFKNKLPFPTFIYASPYTRTYETAQQYAKEIGFPEENIIQDWRISEFEINHQNPYLPKGSIENDYSFDNTERFQGVKERVDSFLNDILKNKGTFYIFSHGVISNYINELFTGKKIASRGRNVKYIFPYIINIK